jgi:hypothetical protein
VVQGYFSIKLVWGEGGGFLVFYNICVSMGVDLVGDCPFRDCEGGERFDGLVFSF